MGAETPLPILVEEEDPVVGTVSVGGAGGRETLRSAVGER